MTTNAFRHTAIAAAIFGSAAPAFAQDCASNFQVGKNKAGGASYSTLAQLPGNSVEQAYQLSQQVVGQEGWKVYQTHPAQYAAFARNSQVTASGKTGELTFSTAVTDNGIVLAIVYDNPPGVNSPANAVKDHFCKIADSLRKQIAAAPGATPAAQVASGKVTGASAAVVYSTPDSKACLGKACLGMTLAEAAALDLEPSSITSRLGLFGAHVGRTEYFGLAPNGKRVYINNGSADKQNIQPFLKGLEKICKMPFTLAGMKAKDGSPITLHFRPTMKNGKAVLVLNEIYRHLPTGRSKNEIEAFNQAAQAQYGDLLNRAWGDRPAVTTVQLGNHSLRLLAPYEDVAAQMMEQPGCLEKASLD